jgi:glycosyltransferase involved in cell wall biosynthesis
LSGHGMSQMNEPAVKEMTGAGCPASASEAMRLDGVRVLVLFGGDRMFGSEIGNLEVFRQMAKLGVKASFITSSRWGYNEIQPELDRLGFEWTTAPFGYHWGKYIFGRYFYYLFFNLYGVLATNVVVWREVQRWQPTHLYVMNWMFYSYAAAAIGWLRLPLIYRAGDELPTHTRFHRWVVSNLSRRVTRVVCISNFIQQCMVGVGFAADKTKVIYNYPSERGRRLPLPELPAVPGGAVVLVYVGRVSVSKGAVLLVDAVEGMIQRGANVVLWIAGKSGDSDDTCDELRKRVELTGTQQRIFFLGHVDDVNRVYSQADIHICPSLVTEALSHVVLEAKQCGRTSVVFPTGGLPELIEHGVDGFICRGHTADALVEGIEFFVNNPEARKRCGKAARRSLEEKFNLERFRAQWADIFLSTVNAGRRNKTLSSDE